MLFAVALHPLALKLQNRVQTGFDTDETCPTLLSSWYLDDGYIIAHHGRMLSALEFLRSDQMRSHGFHLNLSKCELWWPAEPPQDVKASYPVDLSQVYIDGTLVLNAPSGQLSSVKGSSRKRLGLLSLFLMALLLSKIRMCPSLYSSSVLVFAKSTINCAQRRQSPESRERNYLTDS